MRTKLLRLCMALGLAVAALGIATVPTTSATTGSCQNTTPDNYHSGRALGSSTQQFDRIVADIEVSTLNDFGPCTTSQGNDGALAWVSIEPGSANPDYTNEQAIIQVGIVRCNNGFYNACQNIAGGPRYWYATGGCGGAAPTPIDLGPADTNPHQYKVAEGTSSWYFYIDNVARASILKTEPRIRCWITEDLEAGVFSEKWDRGDSIGTGLFGRYGAFRDIEYSYAGDPDFVKWNNQTELCGVASGTQDHCVHSEGASGQGDGFNMWTAY